MKKLLTHPVVMEIREFFTDLQPLAHILLILLLSWIALRLTRRLVRLFKAYLSRRTESAEELKRVETLSRVFHYTASVTITVVAGMLILSELGISIAPLLATAGVAGVAAGFAAQSLIKDYFHGFFLLLENQVRQGDVVEVGGKAGFVEEMTLRYIRLRDYDGNVHYVPNGVITTVTNMSRGFAFAVIDVGIAYRESVDEAFTALREIAREMRLDPRMGPRILEDLEIAGVDKLADSAVILRCRFKVMPLEQWNVKREFLRRIKQAFDERGIEIPFPHVTVYAGQGKDGSAPAFHLAGSPEPLRPGK